MSRIEPTFAVKDEQHAVRLPFAFEPRIGQQVAILGNRRLENRLQHARGFEPTITCSTHLIVNPMLDQVVRDHAARERSAIEGRLAEAAERSTP